MINQLQEIPYINDILHQPQALQDTLSALGHQDFAPFSSFASQLRSGKLRHILLTGMGSSFYALHPLYLALLKQGLSAHLLETSELVHHASALLTAEALIVAVSQSGASAEILQLLDRLPPQATLIGVTNTPGTSQVNLPGAVR